VAAANRYFADRCPQHAAGIAYRVLFSSVPLAVVLVSVFGVMLGNAEVRDAVVTAIVNALPAEAADRADVAGAISSITPPPGLLGLLTLAVFVWSATGMMAAIRAGLEVATHAQHGRPVVRGKLIDLLLVVGAALLVLTTVALTALDRLTQHALHRIETATGIDAPLSGTLLPRLSDALVGAVITAILFLGISLASGLIYRSATHLSVVYGSLTGVFVFLYAVYLYASALLFGAEAASAWSAPAPPVSEPLGVQLRRAVRGLFTSTDARQPDEAAAPAPTRE
jgi:membrane protein